MRRQMEGPSSLAVAFVIALSAPSARADLLLPDQRPPPHVLPAPEPSPGPKPLPEHPVPERDVQLDEQPAPPAPAAPAKAGCARLAVPAAPGVSLAMSAVGAALLLAARRRSRGAA